MAPTPETTPLAVRLADGKVLAVPPRDRGFRHIRSPHGTLILPSDTKQVWEMDERPFRSLLIAPDGRVLSSGFPKFGNLKERGFEDHLEDLRSALTHGTPVLVLDKLDGSLIVRSVIDGQVHWRTRGSWGLGAFETPVMELVARHGRLTDPSFAPGLSLLFEFCSSDSALRVVLAHDEDSLTLLGAVDNGTLRPLGYDEVGELAAGGGVPLVGTVTLGGSLNDWRKQVSGWTGREGVVIRLADGGMLKLKSSSYLTLHRLKTSFSLRATKRLILREGLRSKAQFTDFLTAQGADWETVHDLEPLIDASAAAHERALARFPELCELVDITCMRLRGQRAKQVGELNQIGDEAERQAALLLLDGREREAERALERLLVERALLPFDSDDEHLQEG